MKKKIIIKKFYCQETVNGQQVVFKKKPAFKCKTVMNKLIEIIVFVLISFSAFMFVFKREFLILELSVFSFFLKKSVVKKRRVATSKKK